MGSYEHLDNRDRIVIDRFAEHYAKSVLVGEVSIEELDELPLFQQEVNKRVEQDLKQLKPKPRKVDSLRTPTERPAEKKSKTINKEE